jgi:integrase
VRRGLRRCRARPARPRTTAPPPAPETQDRTGRGLTWERVELIRRSSHLRIPRSATKTDAGERNVPIVVALEARLLAHQELHPSRPGQPAFPTRNQTRQHPDNIRSRILAPIRDRANELLEEEGRLAIGQMTPHSLRRTFASILAACDVPPRRAMYLMGHTDPSLTLAVYQQVLEWARAPLSSSSKYSAAHWRRRGRSTTASSARVSS